jgi:hypothetical protein
MKPKSHASDEAKQNSAVGWRRSGNTGSARQRRGLLILIVGGAVALWCSWPSSVVQQGGDRSSLSSPVLLSQLEANLSGGLAEVDGEVGDARYLRLLPKKSFFSAKPAPVIVVSSSEGLRPLEGIAPPAQRLPVPQLPSKAVGSFQLIPNWDTSRDAAFLLPNYVPGSSETLLMRTYQAVR